MTLKLRSKVLTCNSRARFPLQLALSSTAQVSGNLQMANDSLLAQKSSDVESHVLTMLLLARLCSKIG